MLSKSKMKQVRALEMKKYRDAQQLFVAEGNKLVTDLMKAFECKWLAVHRGSRCNLTYVPAK